MPPADPTALAKKLDAAAKLRPALADIRAELPESAVKIVESEDGTHCDGQVVGIENIRRLYDMQADYNRAKVEIGAEMNAEIETTKISHPKFGVIDCPANLERQIVMRQGARPVRRRRVYERHVYHPSGRVDHYQSVNGRLCLVATEQR